MKRILLIGSRSLLDLITQGQLLALEDAYHAALPALVEALAAAGLIYTLARWQDDHGKPIAISRPLVGLGDISYSLYLLHFPLMTAFTVLIQVAGMETGSGLLNTVILTIPTLLASPLLAWVTYRAVEMPGITLGQLALRPRTAPSVPANPGPVSNNS